MKKVDARGLSCPQPVLLTKQALAGNPDGCQVLVDNPAAKVNVMRYAQKEGYQVTSSEENGDSLLEISR